VADHLVGEYMELLLPGKLETTVSRENRGGGFVVFGGQGGLQMERLLDLHLLPVYGGIN
jgi:hypothetical protein